jgi:hypothetical protein
MLDSSRFTVNDSFFGQTWMAWVLFFILMVSALSFAASLNAWVRRAT